MRVTIDRSRCQGHALCVLAAPDLFDLDDVDSHAYVRVDPMPASVGEAVHSAAQNCPEQAISVAD
ncbi:ferredoxin [Frankia sp. Cas3]|uniref:ferredoxin n=1 Tax=Frankia sp. Cas3 TaxID=3073926 RepID=UPI002AD230A7|nr:ferredoxin [Frankia sp. Cas3]